MKLSETIAVVTGGASGIGEAAVRQIVAAGGKCAILDMNTERGTGLADELGAGVIHCDCDVTDEDSIIAALDACETVFGGVTAALNFAGIAVAVKTLGRDGPHSMALYRKVVDINLNGTFNVCSLASERMQKNTANADGEMGVMVNTASVAAFDGQKGQAAYAASKAGVAGLTLPMARDLASYGIRVNAIAPGLILTPMLQGLPQEAQDALAQQPLFPKRLGKPEEVAALACFMIESSYMNGETVRLDAGIRLP
jgi:NAD(P)-dependent dehydrogenase (short-subunit alcohol dehydrogenase family)